MLGEANIKKDAASQITSRKKYYASKTIDAPIAMSVSIYLIYMICLNILDTFFLLYTISMLLPIEYFFKSGDK